MMHWLMWWMTLGDATNKLSLFQFDNICYLNHIETDCRSAFVILFMIPRFQHRAGLYVWIL